MNDIAQDLELSLEQLSISESKPQQMFNHLAPQERVIINVRYLLTRRFEEAHESIMRLIETLVEALDQSFIQYGGLDLLDQISRMRVNRNIYKTWEECIGMFLKVFGSYNFFKAVPLRLEQYDLNSLTYS